MTDPLSWLLIQPIRVYQSVVSPLLGPRCRYAPTCSQYAVEALAVHGPVKGLLLGAWRLVRCNPWSHGGVDHVPPRGRWRSEPWVPPEDWAGNAEIERPVPMGLSEAPAHVDAPIDRVGAPLVHDGLPGHPGRPADATRVPTT